MGGGTQKAEQVLKEAELFEETGIPAGLFGLPACPQHWSFLPQVWLLLPVGGCLHRSALGNLILPQPFSSKRCYNREPVSDHASHSLPRLLVIIKGSVLGSFSAFLTPP